MSGAGTTGLTGGGGCLRRVPSELSACSPAPDGICMVVKGSWSLRPLPLSPGLFSICLPCADGLIFCLRAVPAKAWPAAPMCSAHPLFPQHLPGCLCGQGSAVFTVGLSYTVVTTQSCLALVAGRGKGACWDGLNSPRQQAEPTLVGVEDTELT